MKSSFGRSFSVFAGILLVALTVLGGSFQMMVQEYLTQTSFQSLEQDAQIIADLATSCLDENSLSSREFLMNLDVAAKVSGSRLALGSSLRSAGRNRAASFLSSSHRFKSSINPDHRHRAPARERHSSTAAPAPSSAAADTSAMRPHAAPHRTEAVTMAVHINAIANALTS